MFLQILNRIKHRFRVVIETPQTRITFWAQHAPNMRRAMTMVNRRSLTQSRKIYSTDCTFVSLVIKHCLIFRKRNVIPLLQRPLQPLRTASNAARILLAAFFAVISHQIRARFICPKFRDRLLRFAHMTDFFLCARLSIHARLASQPLSAMLVFTLLTPTISPRSFCGITAKVLNRLFKSAFCASFGNQYIPVNFRIVASFATRAQAIFTRFVFDELPKRFDGIAMTTPLIQWYALVSHSLNLLNSLKLWLGRVKSYLARPSPLYHITTPSFIDFEFARVC